MGRRPRAETPDVQVVEIADVARSLSRTHLRIRVAHGVAWVEDAGSANGTRLVTPDGERVRLVPGEPARLVPGAVLELGQVRIDVALD
ncbi:FHA domain-containing protein [Serinibacter arcticus]|uniref:FHA domain-containing protein n=1 Tax=Serinibacter arcticus TaxID=1655435 RepID=UPI001304DF82|nr:FHA domain-containing protein [Serinibacter arcticus]